MSQEYVMLFVIWYHLYKTHEKKKTCGTDTFSKVTGSKMVKEQPLAFFDYNLCQNLAFSRERLYFLYKDVALENSLLSLRLTLVYQKKPTKFTVNLLKKLEKYLHLCFR